MTTLQSVRPAPIWKRIVAGVIDFFILWLLLWPTVCLLGFRDIDSEIAFMRTAFGWMNPVLPMLVVWLFPYCLRDLVGGRSFGKWLMGMRVVDSADLNTKATAERLILRNLTIWLSPVGIVSAAFNSDRMRFGDRLAHTIVVEDYFGPSGPNWRLTLTKAVSFAVVAGMALFFAQHMMARYYEGSRACRAATAFLNGCAPLNELLPGAPGAGRTFQGLRFAPAPDGAVAQIGFTQTVGARVANLAVIMRRPPDNVADWRGADVMAAFEPGWPADNAPASVLNETAMSFLKTYAPLHAAVRDLRPEKTALDRTGLFLEKGKEWAGVSYRRSDERWAAQFVVALRRGDAGWSVFDAMGVLDLNIDNASARKVYIFRKSKDISRYLGAAEMEPYLKAGTLPPEAVPDFKLPADNATVAH